MAPPGIPTPYGGVTFRSGTEAKWGIFFDALDLKWEYETQGFDAGGVWYLPDFMLLTPGGIIWAEVKPTWTNDPQGVAKFRRFAAYRPQPSRAALLVGLPSTGHGHLLVIGGDEDAGSPLQGPWEDDTQEWRPCGSGHHFDLACAGTFRAKFAEDGCADDFGGNGEERIEKAVEAARSAKFGKNGTH